MKAAQEGYARKTCRGIAILALAVVAISASSVRADTIDLAYEYLEAGGQLDAYVGSTHYYWDGAAGDGVMQIATQNPVGPVADLLKPTVWAACYELEQFTAFSSNTYEVKPLDAVMSADKAALMTQLWAKNYDYFAQTSTPVFYGDGYGGFVPGEPANNAENINSIAFIYAIYEIRYDYDGTLGSLDPTSGTFRLGPDQYPSGPPTVLDATQSMLAGLVNPQDYQGYMPTLLALTNPDLQDVIVELQPGIPEPATMGLLAIGSLVVLRRRRRK